jgi:hypothetical protein
MLHFFLHHIPVSKDWLCYVSMLGEILDHSKIYKKKNCVFIFKEEGVSLYSGGVSSLYRYSEWKKCLFYKCAETRV